MKIAQIVWSLFIWLIIHSLYCATAGFLIAVTDNFWEPFTRNTPNSLVGIVLLATFVYGVSLLRKMTYSALKIKLGIKWADE